MRTVRRPRRYVARHWLILLRPILRYSQPREAFVLRGVGSQMGPVLRIDRRVRSTRRLEGADDRRHARRLAGLGG
jgi:hypothetical protein